MNTLLLQQLQKVYATSRACVVNGDAENGRKYLLVFVNGIRSEYEKATTVVERLRIIALLQKWAPVLQTLRESGIDETVKTAYGIGVATEEVAKGVADEPLQQPETEPTQPPRQVDYDSQGWCADIFEKYRNAVVRIRAESRKGNSVFVSGGTGFAVAKKYFVTNHHVVYEGKTKKFAEEIFISFEGKFREMNATVIDADSNSDVALCYCPEAEFDVIPLISDYESLRQGADVLVIGNAFSMGLAPFCGIIKFTRNSSGDLIYTAPSNPGDSGGPVLNHKGECVGINKSIVTGVIRDGNEISAQGITNATPADTISALLGKWKTKHGLIF